MKEFWLSIKDFAHRFLGGLFMEEKAGKNIVSLGRVALTAVLLMFFWMWRRSVIGGESGIEMPPGMLEVFYTLSVYVFGSKVADVVKNKWSQK